VIDEADRSFLGIELATSMPAARLIRFVEQLVETNRTYREEVLTAYLFDSISDAGEITDDWLGQYNEMTAA
jgi:hypothetical protein